MSEVPPPLPEPGETWHDERRNVTVKILCLMPAAPHGLSHRDSFIVHLSAESAARLVAHAACSLPLIERRSGSLSLKVVFHCDGPDCHEPPFVLYQKVPSGAVHLMSSRDFLAGRFRLKRPHQGDISSRRS
jgi:hypothetical protein